MSMGPADRDFTLRQLRTFICAARTGSFSHAAAELGISQPAVSDQIALLEDRLGHMLFVRRLGTTPKLTPEGAKLLETAGTLINTSREMRREDHQKAMSVRMFIGPRALELYLKPLLPNLYRDYPGLNIHLVHHLPRQDIPAALECGRIDLVVYTANTMPKDWKNARPACKVMVVMAGLSGIRQRLASGAERIEDLQYILPTVPTSPVNPLEQRLHEHGIHPSKPIIHLEFADVILQMVENGQGVTMLTYEQLASSIAAGRLELFGPDLPSMQRVVARSNHAPKVVRVIEDRLINAMSGPPPGARSM
jgi:DNA-binding transcriptional LysR family regulator